MPRLRDLDLDRHLADPAMKQRFVTPMFDLIAPRYDAFTRLFSYGMDRQWKRAMLKRVVKLALRDATVLDLACGTGDLAFAVARAMPHSRVTGLDASPQMIALARERKPGVVGAPEFVIGDMAAILRPDNSVDVITAGYGFRNTPDHRVALREAARILRPGGVMVTLDFYRPESALWRTLLLGYLRAAGNAVGWLWHREPVAYGYIAPSIAAFVSYRTFATDLSTAGFEVVYIDVHLFGGVAIHVAVKHS
jgi:demethylmenaquinone methyltransferase/2-methoxy-6-polyprenyl-1,4-benzoquinol methylase